MVPEFYKPTDSAEIKAFQRVIGSKGEPLLADERTVCSPVQSAQERLIQILLESQELLREKYAVSLFPAAVNLQEK